MLTFSVQNRCYKIMNISFAMLSGGNAKRFGSDKTIALYKNKPLFMYGLETGLLVSSDVLLVSKDTTKYKPYLNNIRYVQDDLEEVCPMSGLIKVAKVAKYDDIFIISADAPLISSDFILFLYKNFTNCDGVMPVFNGKSYTLMSFYKRYTLLSMIEDYKNKNYKIITALSKYNIKKIDESIILSSGFSEKIFTNINYKDDLKKLDET